MRLLDPRFRYLRAVATDVGATWRRFGFDSRGNEKRRERLKQRIAEEASEGRSATPALRPLVRVKASC